MNENAIHDLAMSLMEKQSFAARRSLKIDTAEAEADACVATYLAARAAVEAALARQGAQPAKKAGAW
jgi:hypothetical protein